MMGDVLSATALVGQAFNAIKFPDLYKIQDFHSEDAKPLKKTAIPPLFAAIFGNGNIFNEIQAEMNRELGIEEDESKSGEDGKQGDNEEEEELGESGPTEDGRFAIVAGDDRVILDDVCQVNKDGWTPLHALCHSFTTANNALILIEEICKRKGDLNVKTINGPGAYNSEWTPLHMACAYGLETVVERLCREDSVDVNCENSNSMTPLLECCYRGYRSIAKILIERGADVHHLPDVNKFRGAPFIRPHPQRPLGEACRCGFIDIVKLLLQSGCSVNEENDSNWTPIHEACFCNHLDVVQLLIEEGADCTIKTEHGALPYNLAVTTAIRGCIKEHGGEGAVPENEEPFSNLMFGTGMGGGPFTFAFNFIDDGEDDGEGGRTHYMLVDDDDDDDDEVVIVGDEGWGGAPGGLSATSPQARVDMLLKEGAAGEDDASKTKEGEDDSTSEENKKPKETVKEEAMAGVALINEGGLLGDLPSLTPQKSPSKEEQGNYKSPTKSSKNKTKKKKLNVSKIPLEIVPEKFKCQITHKLLKRPVRTPYDNVYEEKVIQDWFKKQGSICPISGQPLTENELVKDNKLASEIVHFVEDYFSKKKEKKKSPKKKEEGEREEEGAVSASVGGKNDEDDDQYDF